MSMFSFLSLHLYEYDKYLDLCFKYLVNVSLVKYLCSIVYLIVFILKERGYIFLSLFAYQLFKLFPLNGLTSTFHFIETAFPSLTTRCRFNPTTSANGLKRSGVSGDSKLLEHYYRFNQNKLKQGSVFKLRYHKLEKMSFFSHVPSVWRDEYLNEGIIIFVLIRLLNLLGARVVSRRRGDVAFRGFPDLDPANQSEAVAETQE